MCSLTVLMCNEIVKVVKTINKAEPRSHFSTFEHARSTAEDPTGVTNI